MSIADIGRAENQPISAEVREFLDDEIAQLQRRINELEEQAESFKVRLANQETTIRVQAETIAKLEGLENPVLAGLAQEPFVVDMHEVPAFKRFEVTRLTKEGARCKWTLGLRNYVETLPICVAEALLCLFDSSCPPEKEGQ